MTGTYDPDVPRFRSRRNIRASVPSPVKGAIVFEASCPSSASEKPGLALIRSHYSQNDSYASGTGGQPGKLSRYVFPT